MDTDMLPVCDNLSTVTQDDNYSTNHRLEYVHCIYNMTHESSLHATSSAPPLCAGLSASPLQDLTSNLSSKC